MFLGGVGRRGSVGALGFSPQVGWAYSGGQGEKQDAAPPADPRRPFADRGLAVAADYGSPPMKAIQIEEFGGPEKLAAG